MKNEFFDQKSQIHDGSDRNQTFTKVQTFLKTSEIMKKNFITNNKFDIL